MTIVCAIFLLQAAFAQTNYGSIEGKITDLATKEPLLFATVAVFKTGSETPITGTETDLDGNYSISMLDPGIYDIQASYSGYDPISVQKIEVKSGEVTRLNIGLRQPTESFGCDFYWVEPMISMDNTTSGKVIRAKDIQKSPLKW